MAALDLLLAAALDPIQAALVLAIVLAYRGPQPIIVAGVTAAVVSEAIMELALPEHTWLDSVAPRLAAALMQASVICWLVTGIRRLSGAARTGMPALMEPGMAAQKRCGPLETAGAAFRALIRTPVRRLAPWHMRAYVRRHIFRLLHR